VHRDALRRGSEERAHPADDLGAAVADGHRRSDWESSSSEAVLERNAVTVLGRPYRGLYAALTPKSSPSA
jgi:hypothetical protein